VFEDWYENSPKKMLFAVKANRFITHMRKLTQPEEPITRLFGSILSLKEKLGPVLFQLPPKWNVNVTRFQEFLEALPKTYRYAFEFRNETWYNEEIYQLLKQCNCAFCIYQLARHMSPIKVTSDFVYLRLHGPTEFKYQGSYSNVALKKWAKQCVTWQKEKKEVYVYFDNDQEAYAVFNALTLKKACRKPKNEGETKSLNFCSFLTHVIFFYQPSYFCCSFSGNVIILHPKRIAIDIVYFYMQIVLREMNSKKSIYPVRISCNAGLDALLVN
jgi:uncharacterized protein YecE (DUF72 family)